MTGETILELLEQLTNAATAQSNSTKPNIFFMNAKPNQGLPGVQAGNYGIP